MPDVDSLARQQACAIEAGALQFEHVGACARRGEAHCLAVPLRMEAPSLSSALYAPECHVQRCLSDATKAEKAQYLACGRLESEHAGIPCHIGHTTLDRAVLQHLGIQSATQVTAVMRASTALAPPPIAVEATPVASVACSLLPTTKQNAP